MDIEDYRQIQGADRMYPYTIADVAYSLVKLGMIYIAVLIVEGVAIKLYDRWKERRDDRQ